MECTLSKGELIRLNGGKSGILLHCVAGTLWLTSGDGADYLIEAGTSFEVTVKMVAIVEALESVEFRLGEASVVENMLTKPLTGFVAC